MKSKSTQPATVNKTKMAIGMLFVLCIGGIIGWFIHKPTNIPVNQTKLIRANPSDYKFINPIVLAQVPENTSIPQLQTLKSSINQYITSAKNNSMVTDASVYFRQLNTDNWIGVNADDTYAPASMLKVVSLVAFLEAEQQNPDLTASTITISPQSINTDSNQDYYPPADTAQLGHTYTPQQLMSLMILDSDNNAEFSLDQVTGNTILNKTYSDLGITNPNNTTAVDNVSTKMFSRVFRSLYNGAYLSPAVSEQALALLSKSTFTQGLVAGVPSGTTVAHKFGERTVGIQDANDPAVDQTIHELHDCGIIYAPNDPYLLCVMTKGGTFPQLQKVISDISDIAWKSVQQIDAKN